MNGKIREEKKNNYKKNMLKICWISKLYGIFDDIDNDDE